jgi:hypothetical protein
VIAWNVGADVEIAGERRQARIAGVRPDQQGARLRIALTIEQKVLGKCARKDADIGLHAARRHAGRVPGIGAGADRASRRAWIRTVPSIAMSSIAGASVTVLGIAAGGLSIAALKLGGGHHIDQRLQTLVSCRRCAALLPGARTPTAYTKPNPDLYTEPSGSRLAGVAPIPHR